MALTTQQQELAASPRAINFARKLARQAACSYPWAQEELEAAALAGLVEAAATYDPSRGYQFLTHAVWRIRGAIADWLRDYGLKGYRRRNRDLAPTVQSLDAPAADEVRNTCLAETLPSESLPVGWEIEALDGIERLLRKLPENRRGPLRSYLTQAGATMKKIGKSIGVCESQVSNLVRSGIDMLREELTKGESACP